MQFMLQMLFMFGIMALAWLVMRSSPRVKQRWAVFTRGWGFVVVIAAAVILSQIFARYTLPLFAAVPFWAMFVVHTALLVVFCFANRRQFGTAWAKVGLVMFIVSAMVLPFIVD